MNSCGIGDAIRFRDLRSESKFKLLFYLVTRWFAQRLCRSRREKFALEFKASVFDPDEQVLSYPDAVLQVPYNQQLGQCRFRVCGAG